jgi:uroporphyrin-3 C-methyltransferase
VSEQQDKNQEQLVQETAVADEASGQQPAQQADTPPDSRQAPQQNPAAERSKGSSPVAWLAILLVLVLAAGGAWLLRELQLRETTASQRLLKLEQLAGAEQVNLDSQLDGLSTTLEQQLRAGMSDIQAGLSELKSEVGGMGGESGRLAESIALLQTQLDELRAEMARYSATDRQDWLLAEAEYLLRLANQRLIMAADVNAAQGLLNSADDILRQLDDVGFHPVRAAIAADLAAVRAAPKVDVEGIYLRLSALVEQGAKLEIFKLPARAEQAAPAPADTWQARLHQGYEAALAKLSSYIIIRRRDVPMQALMDPQWEGLVRQNLRMLLEQAQVALLSRNQTLYRESLERSLHWVEQFSKSDESAAQAMAREIQQLDGLTIAVQLPDISRSLRALEAALEQRTQQGGVE